MLKYMFIDESGDLGEIGSKYLVISCILVDDIAPLERIMKNIRRYKFKKILKKVDEIKASSSSHELIHHILKKLNDTNFEAHFAILEKSKLYSTYLKNNKHKLYNFVAGKLGSKLIINNHDIEIRIDKSKGKQVLRDDFNNYFCKLLKLNSTIQKIKIHHSYSHGWVGLQFADILA